MNSWMHPFFHLLFGVMSFLDKICWKPILQNWKKVKRDTSLFSIFWFCIFRSPIFSFSYIYISPVTLQKFIKLNKIITRFILFSIARFHCILGPPPSDELVTLIIDYIVSNIHTLDTSFSVKFLLDSCDLLYKSCQFESSPSRKYFFIESATSSLSNVVNHQRLVHSSLNLSTEEKKRSINKYEWFINSIPKFF